MGEDSRNSHECSNSVSHSQHDGFVRELEERLHDGCSVTFVIPHHSGIILAHEVLMKLKARECYTTEIDLSDVSTVEEFALRVLQAILQLLIDINPLSNYSLNDLLEYLSQPEIRAQIQDFVDLPYMYLVKDSSLELLDECLSLLQRIPKKANKRLVVWFHEFHVIAKIDVLLLKRLRGIFQLQTNVSFAFVGSNPDLMRSLFADRNQAFYRFAVIVTFPLRE